MTDIPQSACPLTGEKGRVRRMRTAHELASSYESYHGRALPRQLVEKYFRGTVCEFECKVSGLRWFEPAIMGETDLYEWLSSSFDWYYSQETWDKNQALECLQRLGSRVFVEAGSGNGMFLRMAKARGINGVGVDINEEAIRRCREEGLVVAHPSEVAAINIKPDVLVSLQSLEHVADPVGFLKGLVTDFPVDTVIISVPSHESLLAYTDDPLVWPPHHFTLWSQKAFEILAPKLGYRLIETHRDRLSYPAYVAASSNPSHGLDGLPKLRGRILGKIGFRYFRLRGFHWARHAHSLLVVLKRQ